MTPKYESQEHYRLHRKLLQTRLRAADRIDLSPLSAESVRNLLLVLREMEDSAEQRGLRKGRQQGAMGRFR